MKLTIAITLSALLAGCAAEEDSLELRREFPNGIEIVVIDPVDVGDVDIPSSMQRPEFPGGDYEPVANDEAQHELPLMPNRPPVGTLPSGAERPTFPGSSDVAQGTDDNSGDRVFPGGRDVYDIGDDDGPRTYPGPTDVYDDSALTKDPCACEDTSCMEEWIADNLGCNVCATFVCGDEHNAGACYLCD